MIASLTLGNSLYETAVGLTDSRGQTFVEFAAEALQAAIDGTAKMQIVVRNGLPCVQPPAGTPQIDPSQVRRWVEDVVF